MSARPRVTPRQIAAIFRLRDEGMSYAGIAGRVHMSAQYVGMVLRGKLGLNTALTGARPWDDDCPDPPRLCCLMQWQRTSRSGARFLSLRRRSRGVNHA